MKVLTIGSGESTEYSIERLRNLNPDIIKFGYAQTYYHLSKEGILFDYLTWYDPNSIMSSLELLLKDKRPPKIIIPHILKKIDIKLNPGLTSFIRQRGQEGIDFYNESVDFLYRKGKIEIRDNIINTRNIPISHQIFTDIEKRFDGDFIYTGTVPYDGAHSESSWARENLFSRLFLPLCHSMGATEVYNIGFDNRGLGFGREIPQFHNEEVNIKQALQKFQTWLDWEKYHGMKIYSVAEDKYTPNNKVLPYKPLDEITKGND